MNPDQPLTIYELRALDEEAFRLFGQPNPRARLGEALAGLHWEADFAFIFFKGEAGPKMASFLSAHQNLDLRQVHQLTYAQWQDGAGSRPFKVGNLSIIPPGFEAPVPAVVIDPGLAFGFGGHPTTKTCLEFLTRICKHDRPGTSLDLGAGTGVLALAAARLGVPRNLGVDYSHLAVEAALNNLALNGLAGQVEFQRGPAQDFAAAPGELLMANLHLSLQEELFELGAFEGRRHVIVSGLLPSEGDRLHEKLKTLSFKLADQVRTDRWVTMWLAPA